MSVFCYKWNDADVQWNTVELTWAFFCIIRKVVETVGSGPPSQIKKKLEKLTKEEKKVLIELFVQIHSQDIEFQKRMNKHKNKNVKITIKDVANFISEVKNIKVGIFINEQQ